jgi:predicted ester cyclase
MNIKRIGGAVLAGFFVFILIGCQPNNDIAVTTELNTAAVNRLVNEAWNKGNLEVIDEILSPDYILHISSPGAKDRDGYHQAVRLYREAFPDFLFTIDDKIAEGDKVVIRATMSGTHEGKFMGIEPTGQKLTMSVISIRRFVNGKIFEEWVEMNRSGLIQ